MRMRAAAKYEEKVRICPARRGARRLQKWSIVLRLVLTLASLAVSPSHMMTIQSFSTEVLPATEERKEAGERRRTMTETQRVRLGVNSTFPWVVRSAVQYSTV